MDKTLLGMTSAFIFILALTTGQALWAQEFPGPPSAAGVPQQRLQGVYSLIGTRTCVQAAQGAFTPDPELRLLAPATTRTSQFTGRLRLNGDGTGTADFRQLQINHQTVNTGQQPVTVADSFCDVVYEILPGGSVTLSTMNCDGPIVSGGGAGGSATSTDAALSVTVSMDGSVLLLSDTEPVIEDVFLTIGGNTFPSSRICGRSYTALRLSVAPAN